MSKTLPATLGHRHVPARGFSRLEQSFAAQRFLGSLTMSAPASSRARADIGQMPIPSPSTCRRGPDRTGPTLSRCNPCIRQGSAGSELVIMPTLGAPVSRAMLIGQNSNNESRLTCSNVFRSSPLPPLWLWLAALPPTPSAPSPVLQLVLVWPAQPITTSPLAPLLVLASPQLARATPPSANRQSADRQSAVRPSLRRPSPSKVADLGQQTKASSGNDGCLARAFAKVSARAGLDRSGAAFAVPHKMTTVTALRRGGRFRFNGPGQVRALPGEA